MAGSRKETPHFAFGENWSRFCRKHFSPERLEAARARIAGFLGRPDLSGSDFLDVGCGSGLSSLAAYDLGARRVVSFDVDPQSVETTRRLRAMRGDPERWEVLCGSILDEEFVRNLPRCDVVYAWGVLHHTGSMWRAVERTAELVPRRGVLYLALYTTTPRTPYWIRLKKTYNRGGFATRRALEGWYILRHVVAPCLARGENPFRYVRDYGARRGMEFFTDLRDWLGGWPYEDAHPEEVLSFLRSRGLEVLRLEGGEANTEYLFRRP